MQQLKPSLGKAFARQADSSFDTPGRDTCLSPVLLRWPRTARDGAQCQRLVPRDRERALTVLWQQKVIQIPMDCTYLHPSARVLISLHPLLQIILTYFTFPYFPTIYDSISHTSHLHDLSVVRLPHLYIWMSPVKYNISQISLTGLHHTKIPCANIRHAWISKEMKTGHRKEVGWGKKMEM